ncbi:MAG: hypothetical protein JW797_13540 [Bradymonadales bacterium]|nr:hypothetical protein [Bradymonadales bacterium]
MSRRHGPQRLTRPALLFALAVALQAGGIARADSDELQLTIGPGYSSLPELGEGLDGIGGGAELVYGFTPFWSIAAGGFVAYHFEDTTVVDPADPPQVLEATTVVTAWLGPRFNLDVFVVVPYLSLSPELIVTQGELMEDRDTWELGLRGTVGLDYRPLRHWSLGFEVSYHSYLTQPLDYPVYLSTLFRLSYHHRFKDL